MFVGKLSRAIASEASFGKGMSLDWDSSLSLCSRSGCIRWAWYEAKESHDEGLGLCFEG